MRRVNLLTEGGATARASVVARHISPKSKLVAADSAEYSLSVAISLVPKLDFVTCQCVMTFHASVEVAAALKTEGNDVKV
jgi:hypothetical protein